MSFIAKAPETKEFKRVPPGVYIARCYSLVDLGTQLSSGEYGEKLQHKIRIGWELLDKDDQGIPLTVMVNDKEMPMTISKSYAMTLHEKSTLRKNLEAWRGKEFSNEEVKAFDISKLLGAYCMLNTTTSESGGKTYTNMSGIMPLPAAMRNSKPAPVHSNVIFDLDQPNMEIFNGFHEKLQETIKKSPEWAALHKPKNNYQTEPQTDRSLDDIPF